jgi:hypothetical protein
VLMYFSPSLQEKMHTVFEKSKKLKWMEHKPTLQQLLGFFKEELGEDYKELIFILAHPTTITAEWWGKLASKILFANGKDTIHMQGTSFDPDGYNGVHGVEIYNAAQSVRANKQTYEQLLMGRQFAFPGIGPVNLANSDAHDTQKLFAAANVVECEELTAEGLLDGIRKARTTPMINEWGLSIPVLGNILPFGTWFLLSPFTDKKRLKEDGYVRYIQNILVYAREIAGPLVQANIHLPKESNIARHRSVRNGCLSI